MVITMPTISVTKTAAAAATGTRIAANELACPVAERVSLCSHRQAFEISSQVLGKLFNRAIAPDRLLAQRFEYDPVEVAMQTCEPAPSRRMSRATVSLGGRGSSSRYHADGVGEGRQFFRDKESGRKAVRTE